MLNNDLKYWLALSSVKDVGPITIKRLLSVFHSPEKILAMSHKELRDIVGESKAKRIREFDSWDKVEKEFTTMKHHDIRIIKYTDGEYPELLKHIDDSPIILYTKGCFIEDDKYAIAIVGSRKMTEYGRNIAEKMAYELASCGFTIVSGMAMGIDTVSHKGALKAGGRSIAVLGSGIDRPYPSSNIRLFETLSSTGCVISEFPLKTPPNKENFPKRNRLISGLSLGVLVIEAAASSGSLITANCALEQGKEVFAIPGSIVSGSSNGTNALIKKGAKLVQKVEDILEELTPQIKGLMQKNGEAARWEHKNTGISNELELEISDEEKAICNTLSSEPNHIDIIARETNLMPSRLLGLLLGLEIKGIVSQTDGKRFYLSC